MTSLYLVPTLLGTGFTIWMAVECVRRGQAGSWLWIILIFGPVGAAVYFFSEVAGGALPSLAPRRTVSAAEIDRLAATARRMDSAATWADLAAAQRSRGRHAAAVEAAERALAREGGAIDAHYERGRSLVALGRAAEAVTSLERVVAADRYHDVGEALYLLAISRRAAGDLSGAQGLLEELAGRSSRADFLYELGLVQLEAGAREAARETFERIVAEGMDVPAFMRRRVGRWVRRARRQLAAMRS